jgi:hypothetical protein
MRPGQVIKVEIDTEGNTTITTSGFTGTECKDATRELERALGRTTSDTTTAEGRVAKAPQQLRQ